MGVATGKFIDGRIYHCMKVVEKPTREIAEKQLLTEGLPDGRYLAHCGIYIFDSIIFDFLKEEASQVEKSHKEVELFLVKVMKMSTISPLF